MTIIAQVAHETRPQSVHQSKAPASAETLGTGTQSHKGKASTRKNERAVDTVGPQSKK